MCTHSNLHASLLHAIHSEWTWKSNAKMSHRNWFNDAFPWHCCWKSSFMLRDVVLDRFFEFRVNYSFRVLNILNVFIYFSHLFFLFSQEKGGGSMERWYFILCNNMTWNIMTYIVQIWEYQCLKFHAFLLYLSYVLKSSNIQLFWLHVTEFEIEALIHMIWMYLFITI